jgi:hypothetical protein
MTAVVWALVVVVALLVLMVVGLLRSHAEILRALHDLGVNLEADPTRPSSFELRDAPAAEAVAGPVPSSGGLVAAHDLMGVTPEGDGVAVAVTGVQNRTLIAFLSSGCATCLGFWDAFAEPRNRTIGGPGSEVVIVTKAPASESPSAVAKLAPTDVVCLMSDEAFDDYGVPVAPYFVLVDSGGTVIGEGVAPSFDQLRSLLDKAVADGSSRRSRRELLGGRQRAARIDRELADAGITPGHPSLHSDPRPDR